MRALVTGASRGVGAAVAEILAKRGDEVWTVARESGDERRIAIDLASAGAAERVAAALGERTLDAFVSVAGIARQTPFGAITREDLEATLAVNLVAPILLTQALAPRLVDGASIVHVSSNLAHRPVPNRVPYIASKGGLEAAVRALALELAPRQIRVNAVALGIVRTAMVADLPLDVIAPSYPLGIGTPADAARAIVSVLELPWTTGSVFLVDGGALIQTAR